MKYRDEIHIAMMALVFSCAMFAIYAVVPKDAVVAAKARATVTEAPETAAEAEAIRSSQEEDAGFPIYTQDSNYDYDDSSDDSDNSDTGTDTSDTLLPIQLLPTRTIPMSIHPLTTIMMTVPVIM